MLRWFVRRCAGIVIVLLVLTSGVFLLLRVLPGSPILVRVGQPLTPEQLKTLTAQLGLDKPLLTQYVDYVRHLVVGNFGQSYFSGDTVTHLVRQRIGASFELALAATFLGLAVAIPAAITASLSPGSWLDRVIASGAMLAVAVPAFWLGLLLVTFCSVQWGILPSRGYVSLLSDPAENLRHLALPAITLAVGIGGPTARFLRAALLEQLSADYMRTARGKGLTWRTAMIRHGLQNSAIPTLHFIGIIIGSLLGGVVVIEYIYAWPGLGGLALDAMSRRDYPVLQGVVTVAAFAFMMVTLIVDMITRLIDPRTRRQIAS
jgi:peptide/nickel transport system permease protein